jgi:hypothetical protein
MVVEVCVLVMAMPSTAVLDHDDSWCSLILMMALSDSTLDSSSSSTSFFIDGQTVVDAAPF